MDEPLGGEFAVFGEVETKQLSNADSSFLVAPLLRTSSRASCFKPSVGRYPGMACDGTGEVCADTVVVSDELDDGGSSKSSISTSCS